MLKNNTSKTPSLVPSSYQVGLCGGVRAAASAPGTHSAEERPLEEAPHYSWMLSPFRERCVCQLK